MKIVNMTWHVLTLSNKQVLSTGIVRVSYAFFKKEEKINDINVFKVKKICDETLLPIEKNTIYIVSDKVCRALQNRADLFVVHWTYKKWYKVCWAEWIKVNPYYKK